MYGLSFFILFVVIEIIFYISSIFTRNYNLLITDSFSAIFLVVFAGFIAGNNALQMSDLGMLEVAAKKIFKLIDLEDEDRAQIRRGSKLLRKEIQGNISFRKVGFKYGSREE